MVVSLFLIAPPLSFPLGAQETEIPKTFEEEAQKKGTERLQITLIGIASFHEFQELKFQLSRTDGIGKVALDGEAPGLITMTFHYAGNLQEIVDRFSLIDPDRYSLSQKTLPSGRMEITVLRKQP